MKRFNLLLLSPDVSLTQVAFRGLSKVYKNNFVFEARTLEEAHKLLRKLQIDLILVDADMPGANLNEFSSRYQNLLIFGIYSSYTASQAVINATHHKMLLKQDLVPALQAELKALKKTGQIAPASSSASPMVTPNFRDFFVLSKDLAVKS